MSLINFVQLADALDIDGVAVAHTWQAEDDTTGEIVEMFFNLGTSPTDAQSQMGDADTAEKPPPDPIESAEPKWQFNPDTNEYCVFGEDGKKLFIIKRNSDGSVHLSIFTDVNDGRLGVGIADPVTDIHLRRYDNAIIRSEATLVDSDALFQAVNDAIAWSWGTTGVDDNWILAQAFDLATKIRVAVTPSGSFGIGIASPNPSAILDLTSTTKAFILPRMTTTQRDAIASPVAGMVVYNTTTNLLNFFNGTSWGQV